MQLTKKLLFSYENDPETMLELVDSFGNNTDRMLSTSKGLSVFSMIFSLFVSFGVVKLFGDDDDDEGEAKPAGGEKFDGFSDGPANAI